MISTKSNLQIKEAQAHYDLHPLIAKRWSPRSFTDQVITEDQMHELFEAASWAPSAFNEQPWVYSYALRGTAGFNTLWNCLKAGNQFWAQSAACLFVAYYRKTIRRNGKINSWGEHDLGLANAQLLLQALHRNIYGHLMAGFDKPRLIETLNIDENLEPVCMGALGYLGNADQLPEPLFTRETAPRSRKSLDEFVTRI